jgi:hypothetical protein
MGPDALWRGEAGLPLTDHRTPPERVDDLAARFTMLGIDPEAPPAASRFIVILRAAT